MGLILGCIIVIASVFGGFVLANGQLLALWQPSEVIIIVGAALGSFVIANPFKVIIASFAQSFRLVLPAKHGQSFQTDLLMCLFEVGALVRKKGLLSLEDELDDPSRSEIFSKYPRLLGSKRLLGFMIDSFRLLLTDSLNRFELEELLDKEIEKNEEDIEHTSDAILTVADALPGFGIVAAVMGIVITMQFIGGDPKYLGIKVAAALVGTFLGVFLSYGFVGPIGKAIQLREKLEVQPMVVVKTFIISFTSGTQPKMAVEYARRMIAPPQKPGFVEMENKIRDLRKKD